MAIAKEAFKHTYELVKDISDVPKSTLEYISRNWVEPVVICKGKQGQYSALTERSAKVLLNMNGNKFKKYAVSPEHLKTLLLLL